MWLSGRKFAAKHENLSLGLSIHLKSQSDPRHLLITPALWDWWGLEGHGASLDPGSVRDTASEELDRIWQSRMPNVVLWPLDMPTHMHIPHERMCECSHTCTHTCTCKERIGTYALVNIILLISKPLLVSFRWTLVISSTQICAVNGYKSKYFKVLSHYFSDSLHLGLDSHASGFLTQKQNWGYWLGINIGSGKTLEPTHPGSLDWHGLALVAELAVIFFIK